jgi:hypothetical protein
VTVSTASLATVKLLLLEPAKKPLESSAVTSRSLLSNYSDFEYQTGEIGRICAAMAAMIDTLCFVYLFYPEASIPSPFLLNNLKTWIFHFVNIPHPQKPIIRSKWIFDNARTTWILPSP